MNCNLLQYKDKRICVAVSGGKDSMALLHYLLSHATEYNLTLSVVTCDHAIRGEQSASDSAFVLSECARLGVPVLSFFWEEYALGLITTGVEQRAREWRHACYLSATKRHVAKDGQKWQGADVVALAHHANDNAETVLFNLMRGTSPSGLCGIRDCTLDVQGEKLDVVRPIIECTRSQIDEYVLQNNLKYVVDESNFSNDYTRNKIRNVIIPELEKVCPSVVGAIARLSSLCARDEQYFQSTILSSGLIAREGANYIIKNCKEISLFSRACVWAFRDMNLKDYTADVVDALFNLQKRHVGKKFEFLHLTAIKEQGKIVIYPTQTAFREPSASFDEFASQEKDEFCGEPLMVIRCSRAQHNLMRATSPFKTLVLDADKVPKTATVRFFEKGDRFTKFGGGTKKLGDFFTDKKIPKRLRGQIPLVVDGDEVLCVCGVEICDKLKIDDRTQSVYCITAKDYIAE